MCRSSRGSQGPRSTGHPTAIGSGWIPPWSKRWGRGEGRKQNPGSSHLELHDLTFGTDILSVVFRFYWQESFYSIDYNLFLYKIRQLVGWIAFESTFAIMINKPHVLHDHRENSNSTAK